MDYQPLFNFNVFVTAPDGSRNRVNPEQCLLPDSAFQLANILGEAGYPCAIVSGPAEGGFLDVFKGGFAITSTVPWFQFAGDSGPVYARAGDDVAAWWDRAYNSDTGAIDQKTALKNAIVDIKNRIAGN